MTVLTFPSTGGVKSDKVPLVNDVDSQQHQQPTKSFSPKLLESGGSRNVDRNLRSVVFKVVLGVIVLLVAFWFSLFLYKNLLCAECRRDYDGGSVNSVVVASADSLNMQPDDDDRSNGDGDDNEDDDDDVPCKTYHSYAAAKSDMALPVTTSTATDGLTIALSETADYDASQPNDMEDVYKKLEKFALSQAMNRKDAQRRVNDDDVVTVFNENVEVDPKSSSIAQPAIITKSARFIHDFSVNITGIVDVEGQRCFVMPLMRNSVSPPVSLYDLLFKMSSGYYSMDIKKAIGNMRVTKPALKNLNDYGLYISKDCADYSTFLLEKVDGAADV